jgi:beta-phosphoglucomutase-like phosphatase (HAD superfamily)
MYCLAHNQRVVVVVVYILAVAFLSCYSAQGFSVSRSHISSRSTRHYASNDPEDEPQNLLDILRTSRRRDDEDRKRKRDRLRQWISSPSEKSPMVQSINVEDGSTVEPPIRVKSKFESLFAGMPSLSDILGDTVTEPSEVEKETKGKIPSKGTDETWFQQERQNIIDRYDEMIHDSLELLEEQRRDDPDSVPENAEAMIRSVMNQEMEREIQQTKEKLQVENMMQLEAELKAMVNEKNLAMEPPSEKVQQLMEQSEEEYRQREALQSQREEFLRYEEEAFRKAAKENNVDPLSRPSEGQDLDQWVLSRLELIASGKQYEEGGEAILDILDANIEDLRERIEKEERSKGSIRPETLKEWQMYRAIATRLTGGSSSGSDYLDLERQFEGQINERLASWKEYVLKEDDFRRQSGLARGPKLPFEWQEASLTLSDQRQEHLSAAEDLQQRINTRKEINRMSIEALESLLTTSDTQRRDKLQGEIDYLKSTLESNDYLDVDEAFLAASVIDQSPVDLRDVFSSQDDDNSYEPIPFEAPSQISLFMSEPNVGETLNENVEETSRKVQPPSTPFFTDAVERESLEESNPKVRPPSTPFFMDASEGEESHSPSSGILGSMEDQKLEAMFRRAGARTAEERNRIREQWEDFKAAEKEKRDMSGLSGESGDVLTAKIKYKLEDVMKSDGDFDADKILATIGKRPERRRKDSDAQNDIDSDTIAQDQKSSVNQKEVIDSMFRSVSAVGGGRYRDDPDEYAKQKAYYEEIVNKEKEIRESMQSDDSLDPLDPDLDVTSLDDVEYANQVIASLGPRPKPKRIRILDEGEFSDQGGALALKQDDDEDDEDEIEEDLRSNMQSSESDYPPDMPEWLRREQDEARALDGKPKNFPGSTIDQVFDDTDYEKNLRQLAEYERRRSGKGRQMGIDISDVLGRSILETDDYADYKFDNDYQRGRQDNWGSVSFASRKADLMEYTELDVAQLNALIDHRDSTYSTGFSQYIPRVNKPFKDFGAIFRLEGVLVDITGLHLESWTRVAADFGYRVPTFDDVRRASVTRPDLAVKDCLFWTDDFMQCRSVAIAHHKVFCEVFDEWSKQSGVTLPETKFDVQGTQGRLAIGEELVQEQPRSEQRQTVRLTGGEREAIQRITNAWEKTAQEFGKQIPTYDEVLRSTLLSPDIAVAEVFRWTRSPTEIDAIASKFKVNLSGNSGSELTQHEQAVTQRPQHNRPLSKTEVMEIHFHAWLKVAAAFDFDEPTPDEVAAAFVINDPLIAVRDGFAWSEDRNVINQAVDMFKVTLRSLLGQPFKDLEREQIKASPHESKTLSNMPSQDEIFRISKEAWTAVSFYLGHGVPDTAQIQFALTVGPEEAITTGFQWTSDPRRAVELVDLYRQELEKRKTWKSENERGNASTPQSSVSQGTQRKESGVDQDLVYKVAYDAWVATAFRMGYTAPDSEQVIFALTVGPEDAIRTGFQWTEEADGVNEITKIYKDELATRRQSWAHSAIEIDTAGSSSEVNKPPPVTVMDGVRNWVSSLRNVEMPCSVISFLDKDQVDILLEYAGLSNLFDPDKRVSMSSGYSRESQQMLGAALRNERRPDHSVVFDTTPYASAAAHEVEMRSVGVIGPYPRYELLSADTTSNSFSELTAMNIRRLFGERVYDQPMMDAQQAEPETRRPTKTKYFWEED